MKKTREVIQEHIKLVDIVIELLDARVPNSSMNPILSEIIGDKLRIVLLNKADLCNQEALDEWVNHFKSQGIKAVPVNSTSPDTAKVVFKELKSVSYELIKKMKARAKTRNAMVTAIRVMIVGIPNVGKSSLINRLAGKSIAKTGNKPGVTKQKQWIKMLDDFELLDTPGILWPKRDDPDCGVCLALTGAIKDEILDEVELAYVLIERLTQFYPTDLKSAYDIEDLSEEPMENMEKIAKRLGCLLKGNRFDIPRASKLIINDYRRGKFGNIVIERP